MIVKIFPSTHMVDAVDDVTAQAGAQTEGGVERVVRYPTGYTGTTALVTVGGSG